MQTEGRGRVAVFGHASEYEGKINLHDPGAARNLSRGIKTEQPAVAVGREVGLGCARLDHQSAAEVVVRRCLKEGGVGDRSEYSGIGLQWRKLQTESHTTGKAEDESESSG